MSRLKKSLAVTGLISAAIIGFGAPMSFTPAASATQPPKACLDDPYGDGCPHDTDSSGGDGDIPPYVAFKFDGTTGAWSWLTRADGGDATAADAASAAYWGGYTACERGPRTSGVGSTRGVIPLACQ